MVGVVVVSKYVTHNNEKGFSGMVDYMDRPEAIENNYISLSIRDVELDNIEKKILKDINENGNTDINTLIKDKKLKKMICFIQENFDNKNRLTEYDLNYLFKCFFSKDNKFSIKDIERDFNETHKQMDTINFKKEKERIILRLDKLVSLKYLIKNKSDVYILAKKSKNEMSESGEFKFTSYDTNKIFKLVRGNTYLKSIKSNLSKKFNIKTIEGMYEYNYVIKRIKNNIKFGFIKIINDKLEITEKGLIEEDKIENPHRQFLEDKLENLKSKSNEFKRKKDILDEKYSVIDELNYSGMVDYMDREKAKSNNSKSDIGLFTNNKDTLNAIEKENLKTLFNKCQKNAGVMWLDVVSFDNKFLEKHGIYNSKNKILDNRKLKEVVRGAVNEMIKKENLNELAVWCADIHYNTDNIHIHVSTVELNPSKTRGRRKPKSIYAMKSKIVNGITKNNEQYKKINDIIRKNIIEKKKDVNLLDDRQLKKLFIEVHSKLPEDRRQWNYNYKTINNVRPIIDKMTDIYIEKYNKNDLFNLKNELKKQEINLKEAYGDGKNSFYKKYYDTKMLDLKTRMGNTILKEIKNYDYSLKQHKPINILSKTEKKSLIKNSLVAIRLKKIGRILGNSYQHIKNQKDYIKLQNEIERNDEQYEKQ